MPRQPRPPVPAELVPMIESFHLHLRAARKSQRTRDTYVDAVRWLAGRLPAGVDWSDVAHEPLHLRAFFATLADEGYAAGYVNNIGRALQQFFAWLAAEEDLPTPFGPRLKVPPPPKPDEAEVPVIAVEQLRMLLHDAERGRTFEDRRDAAILRLYACTGCRLSELVVDLDAVDLASRELRVLGKGAKVRTVRFDHAAALAVDRYLRARAKHRHAAANKGLWLGIRRRTSMTANGVYQMITRRAERLGLDIHPHLFRHTFAHRWLDAGGAEGDLMELMGWSSPQMLRHYGRSARGARARRAYDRVNIMDGI